MNYIDTIFLIQEYGSLLSYRHVNSVWEIDVWKTCIIIQNLISKKRLRTDIEKNNLHKMINNATLLTYYVSNGISVPNDFNYSLIFKNNKEFYIISKCCEHNNISTIETMHNFRILTMFDDLSMKD